MAVVDDPRTKWRNPRFGFGALFAGIMRNERMAYGLGRAVWGMDTHLMYRWMEEAIGGMPDGSSIVDIPCGGGTAFRALRREQNVRYVAADISPAMLDRARRAAAERGLDSIEFVEADVGALPFADGEFDLVGNFNALHNFPDPRGAIHELARVTKPGGRLLCITAVRGEGPRFDAVFKAYQRFTIFGPGGTVPEVRGWIREAGLEERDFEQSGGVICVEAVKP
jgi:ubiquinone/menaquinone biosynthesis C-methylase UbiE